MRLGYILIAVAISAVGALPHHQKEDYSGHKVYGIIVQRSSELMILQNMYEKGYYFFEAPVRIGSKYQVVVPPNKSDEFSEIVKYMQYQIDINDLQELINLELIPTKLENVDDAFWTQYQSLDSIQSWLRNISDEFSAVASVIEIGRSYENRPIIALEIINHPDLKSIFIEGHIHAREWITSAVITWIINQMFYSENPEIRNMAESVNWYIVPNINPDGFEYSRTTSRLWRKTRSVNSGSTCIGTDANRNFDFAWGPEFGGSSNNPCSETYAGSRAFSELETQVLRNYVYQKLPTIALYISVHSYGQWLLYPYGHINARPSNVAELIYVANQTSIAIAERYGTQYIYGTTYECLYAASGISVDWAFALQAGQLLSYTIELRDKGSYGFILPPEQIIPTSEETLDGLLAMYTATKELGYFN